MDRDGATTLKFLRLQLAMLTGLFVVSAALGGYALARLSLPRMELWFLGSFGIIGFQALLSWRHLAENAAPGSEVPRPAIGIANSITLVRGFSVALLGGFALTNARTDVLAHLPALLYTINLLLDLADGAVARATEKRSALGEVLEHELDSLGVLVASAVLVSTGTLGLWFVAVGVARYLFVGSAWIRRSLGKPSYPLVHSRSGRLLAGSMMAFLAVSLWPAMPAELIRAVAPPLSAFFLAGFARDWLVVTGRLRGQAAR